MPWTNEELFEVVDETDKVIGLRKRGEVHALGLRHRAVQVIIVDGRGRILLQQRAKDKDLMPLKWDFGIAEHLEPNETGREAGRRGAEEELNIKVRNLKFLGKMYFKYKYPNNEIDNESNQIFSAEFDGEIKFKDSEVQAVEFVEKGKLLREMKEKPENFTPWSLERRKFLEKLIQ